MPLPTKPPFRHRRHLTCPVGSRAHTGGVGNTPLLVENSEKTCAQSVHMYVDNIRSTSRRVPLTCRNTPHIVWRQISWKEFSIHGHRSIDMSTMWTDCTFATAVDAPPGA